MNIDARRRRSRVARRAGRAFELGNVPGGVVRAVEVVQSVQSVDNDVVLIAGKPTIVRIYLDPARVPAGERLAGEITWRRGGGMTYLPSMNRVTFAPPFSAPALVEQRLNLELSINFMLPPQAIQRGALEIGLNRVFVPGGREIAGRGELPVGELRFAPAPVLRVRVIGLRYPSPTNPGTFVSPDAVHFAYMKSYLLRAYPIASIDWSHIVIDADHVRPPFGESSSDVANAQLSAIRRMDVAGGVHPRTHYYGLVDDEKGANTMRGSAVLDRTTNVFEFVASGPAGRPNGWTGDTDGSFADWYSAHELGHTFQRRHPGFPPNSQPRDPADLPGFPYPNGSLSPAGNVYIGFDMGEPALGLPMRPLAGDLHSDFMTYADNQWVCKYTYEGILERLVREKDELGA